MPARTGSLKLGLPWHEPTENLLIGFISQNANASGLKRVFRLKLSRLVAQYVDHQDKKGCIQQIAGAK